MTDCPRLNMIAAVGLFFDDPLFEEFTSWLALGLAPYGGGTLGEVQATCALVEDGNDDSWFRSVARSG